MKQRLVFIVTLLVVLISYIGFKPSFKIESTEENFSKGEQTMIKKIKKSDKEWKEILTPEQYHVMRQCGTEKAFTGKYDKHTEKGVYICAGCATPLFSSESKYDHITGWPSFTAPVKESDIDYFDDFSHLMHRIETRCAVCGAHLGHVFDDGPGPTGKHYCINSASLGFKPSDAHTAPESNLEDRSGEKELKSVQAETATFTAGCFWGIEHKFSSLPGVISTVVGYTGGDTKSPTYRQVCSSTTGHAEAVKITYDPDKISYEELLEFFFKIHDPTQENRQGLDIGSQYRSSIFYHSTEQKETAEKIVKKLESAGRFKKFIATQIVPAPEFYKAEEYHQKYYEKLKKNQKKDCESHSCTIE